MFGGFCMKKVLFTDLFNTLISDGISTSYDSKNKEMEIVCRYINEFLKDGNYVAIVTSPGGHGHLNKTFDDTLITINSFINKENSSNFEYYLQIANKSMQNDNIINKDGKKYYYIDSEVQGICINKKEDAITDFLKSIKMPYEIYAIGDSARDIPMLLKVKELGGKSSLIDMRLYRKNMTIDELITKELDVEFSFQIKKILKSMTLEEKMEGYTPELLSLYEKREERKQELYQILYNNDLNLQLIYENYSKFIECQDYYEQITSHFSKDSYLYEDYPFDEDMLTKVMSIPCYSTFNEYYTKVLKR